MGTSENPAAVAAETTDTWFTEVAVALAPQIELLTGANDQPLLYDHKRGTYLHLSGGGLRILRCLDGVRTGAEIAAWLSRALPGRQLQVQRLVRGFLDDLRKMGVLNVPPPPPRLIDRIQELVRSRPMLRLSLHGPVQAILGPVAPVLRQLSGETVAAAGAGLFLLAALLVPAAMRQAGSPGLSPGEWLVVALVCLVLLALHELAHAAVARVWDVPLRDAGLGLLYYLMPVGYVDLTDMYRVRSPVGRVMIALAGPLSDLFWTCLAATGVLTLPDSLARGAGAVLWLQALLLVQNLNPLFPGDGYRIAEAVAGELDLRRRAFQCLWWLLGLSGRAELSLSARRRYLYAAYAAGSTLFFVSFGGGVLYLFIVGWR